MSTEALYGLLEYLQETLSLDNRKWLAEHLVNPREEASPQLTMEDIKERIAQSEKEYAEGKLPLAKFELFYYHHQVGNQISPSSISLSRCNELCVDYPLFTMKAFGRPPYR